MTKEEVIYGLLKGNGYGLRKEALSASSFKALRNLKKVDPTIFNFHKYFPGAGTRTLVGGGVGAYKGLTDELDPYADESRTWNILKNIGIGSSLG
jgi:hypothetical protein